MEKEEALRIYESALETAPYVRRSPTGLIALDGEFSAEALEAIAWLMRHNPDTFSQFDA